MAPRPLNDLEKPSLPWRKDGDPRAMPDTQTYVPLNETDVRRLLSSWASRMAELCDKVLFTVRGHQVTRAGFVEDIAGLRHYILKHSLLGHISLPNLSAIPERL